MQNVVLYICQYYSEIITGCCQAIIILIWKSIQLLGYGIGAK